MMEMRADGLDELVVMLQAAGARVKESTRKVMNREAPKIVERAKLFCPVDTGELEESIHMEKGYEEDSGRLMIAIVAGGEVNGVNVDAYAALIHENYESMKPGPNTIAKREANPGVYIGSKFLTRAAMESEDKLKKAVIQVVEEDLREMFK